MLVRYSGADLFWGRVCQWSMSRFRDLCVCQPCLPCTLRATLNSTPCYEGSKSNSCHNSKCRHFRQTKGKLSETCWQGMHMPTSTNIRQDREDWTGIPLFKNLPLCIRLNASPSKVPLPLLSSWLQAVSVFPAVQYVVSSNAEEFNLLMCLFKP